MLNQPSCDTVDASNQTLSKRQQAAISTDRSEPVDRFIGEQGYFKKAVVQATERK
jgi:hypothetical protein